MAVTQGDIIKVSEFTQYVYDQCKAYLTHHDNMNSDNYRKAYRELKDQIPHGEANKSGQYSHSANTRTNDRGGADVCWDWTDNERFDRILGTVTQYCNSFNNKYGKEINAADTWDFIVKCFYETNCIAEQKFSYYASATASSETEKFGYGTLDNYYSTINQYKSQLTNSSMIKKLLIEAGKTKDLIAAVIEFNKSCEKIYNHGCRNSQSSYYHVSYYVPYHGNQYTARYISYNIKVAACRASNYVWKPISWNEHGTTITFDTEKAEPGYYSNLIRMATSECDIMFGKCDGPGTPHYILNLEYPRTDSSQHIPHTLNFTLASPIQPYTKTLIQSPKRVLAIHLSCNPENALSFNNSNVIAYVKNKFILNATVMSGYKLCKSQPNGISIINQFENDNLVCIPNYLSAITFNLEQKNDLLSYCYAHNSIDEISALMPYFSDNVFIRAKAEDNCSCIITIDEIVVLSSINNEINILSGITVNKNSVFKLKAYSSSLNKLAECDIQVGNLLF